MAPSHQNAEPLLRVENLSVHFPVRGKWARRTRSPRGRGGGCVRAVDGVSFELGRGQTLGLVGESGCGKSTLARAILRLIPATAGHVYFEGRDFFALSPGDLRPLRRRMQIIFQDPVGSLNPRLRVETIVGEALRVHKLVRTTRQGHDHVARVLTRVGLSADDLRRYPHEFSGGQRQRIGIARALALQPRLIICDEPVSALDVSIQAQIMNLLADLQREFGLSYLFIAHNLAVVRHISAAVAVMYFGRIVEQAPTDELFRNPRHPYTRVLLAAAPRVDMPASDRGGCPLPVITGEPPNPLDPPPGCVFHPRCRLAEPRCQQESPGLRAQGGLAGTHLVACHLADRSDKAQELLFES